MLLFSTFFFAVYKIKTMEELLAAAVAAALIMATLISKAAGSQRDRFYSPTPEIKTPAGDLFAAGRGGRRLSPALYHANRNDDLHTIVSQPEAVVAITSRRCQYCDEMKDAFSRAAKGARKPVIWFDTEGMSTETLQGSIDGFPTIFQYTNGRRKEYDGPRTYEGFRKIFN